MIGVAQYLVEIDDAVESAAGSNPCVDQLPRGFSGRAVEAVDRHPALDWSAGEPYEALAGDLEVVANLDDAGGHRGGADHGVVFGPRVNMEAIP